MRPSYKRILLKLSGEALMGSDPYGINRQTIEGIVAEIAQVASLGVEIGIVIGGGNIFRGIGPSAQGLERASADYMGMLATVINSLALQSALESQEVATLVQSAINMQAVCEPYIRRRAIRHMEKGRVVICAAGTGNPFFTTDTAAALRTAQLGCTALLKGTPVDGVYSADPKKGKDAGRFDHLSFHEVLAKDLKVMDATALTLCRDQKLPINVFSIFKWGALKRVVMGEDEGTLVHN